MNGGSINSKFNYKTLIYLLILLVFISLAIYYYYYHFLPSLKLKYKTNHEPTESSQNNGKIVEILFFYANWCPHCKSAKPVWNDLKTKYENKIINGYTIIFTEIDCSNENAESEKMMNKYNVEGFPTIKLIKDGQVIDFDAKPTQDSLDKFLNSVI
jgi:thiol-disulfide isomerase/thioredoxin